MCLLAVVALAAAKPDIVAYSPYTAAYTAAYTAPYAAAYPTYSAYPYAASYVASPYTAAYTAYPYAASYYLRK